MTRRFAVAALVLLAACGPTPRLPPPPTGVAAVGVAPVENKTGNKLVVSGDSYVAKWIGWEKKTVPDVLAKELETALADRGFAAAGSGAPKLKVVLTRFEPDLPQLAWVNVSLTATLADPDGTVRWSGERSSWMVSTSGSPSIESAYGLAARTIARQLVEGWEPKGQ